MVEHGGGTLPLSWTPCWAHYVFGYLLQYTAASRDLKDDKGELKEKH